MGTWGTGIFDGDAQAEVFDDVFARGVSAIEDAFAPDKEFEIDGAFRVHGPSVMAAAEIVSWAHNGVGKTHRGMVDQAMKDAVKMVPGPAPGFLARIFGAKQEMLAEPIPNAAEIFQGRLTEIASRPRLVETALEGLGAIESQEDALDLWGAWSEADPGDFEEFKAIFSDLKSRLGAVG